MNKSSSLRNSLRVALTFLLFSSTPLLAETTPAKKESTISLKQLQDRSVRALKQIDVCESILDTLGQGLASGASKLPENKKIEVKLNLQLLRKNMSIIKDAYAIHIDEHQLIGLVNLTNEAVRVLTAAVNSGLEVVPALNDEVLAAKTTAVITLKKIDSLLTHNDKQLKKLAELSEKVGLTKLNKMYRSARKAYKKYYVWPIIERTIVYTAFVHWAVFATSEWKLEELEKTGGVLSPLGTLVRNIKGWIGSPIHPTKKDIGLSANLVVEDPNTGEMRFATEADLPSFELTYDEDGMVRTPKQYLGHNLISGKPSIQVPISNEVPGTTSPKGKLNNATDWTSGFANFDFKATMFTWAPGVYFGNYLYEDFKVASAQCSKITSQIDDILFGTTKKRSYESLTTPDERFSNIVGREEVKTELNKVVEYICSPDKFDRAGIKIERGYLLAGDPQNGKTFMAKALTGEINDALKKMGRNDKMRLFEISTDALISKGIAHYMDLARYHAPCILFLDELDLLRLQRDGDSKLLSEFLTSMSGTLSKDEKSHVIILAATNKPENLDFALRQHGRFGKMFWFDKPTFNHRITFFKKECEKRCMNIARFNFEELAKQTEGCSFGSLDIVMKKALMLAKFSGNSVTQTHFEKALDSEVKKMIPHGYDVPKEKEEVIAVHQAGKALMNILLAPQKQLSKVTILPITQDLQEEHVTQQYNIAGLQSKDQRAIRYGGIFSYNWSDSLNLESQDELKKQCKILLAGNIAQTVYGLPSPSYDKLDKQEAFKLAKQIVFEGLDQKEIAKAIREDKLTQAYRLVEQYEREIGAELEDNKAWLIATTQALQERKTLSIGELNELQDKI